MITKLKYRTVILFYIIKSVWQLNIQQGRGKFHHHM